MTIEERLNQIEICLEQIKELLSFVLTKPIDPDEASQAFLNGDPTLLTEYIKRENRIQEIGAGPSDFIPPFFEERAGGGDQHAPCPNKT